MNRYLLFLAVLLGSTFLFGGLSWALCPEDPIDLGVCDTLTVYDWDAQYCDSFPCLVHVPLLVTHDSNTFWWSGGQKWVQDSVSGFIIPLTWTYTNTSAYCSLTSEKNTTSFVDTINGIFRHFAYMRNRMLELYEMGGGLVWSPTMDILNYDPSHPDWPTVLFLSILPTGTTNRRWREGERVLLATMTFTISDTMTICIDKEPPVPPGYELTFTRIDALNYEPRSNIPFYMSVQLSIPGDANGNGEVHIEDIVYLLNYLYMKGPAPPSLRSGDANCDGMINSADIIYLVNYLFGDGLEPSC